MRNNIEFIHIIENRISKNDNFLYQFKNSIDTAIVIHVFYIDIWKELEKYLKNINISFDLHITFADTLEDKDILAVYASFPEAYYYSVKNQGRDVLPFLNVMSHIGVNQYKYICKLHTKKTNSSPLGDVWRKLLYFDLIGSNTTVNDIISLLKNKKTVGIISGKNTLLDSVKFDFENKNNVQNLTKKMNKPYLNEYLFPAGTMFWIRPQIVAPLLDLLENNKLNFEREIGQKDNTLAHAVERVFGLLCKIDNFTLLETNNSYKKLDDKTLDKIASLVLQQQYVDFELYKKTLNQIAIKDKDIRSLSEKLSYTQSVVEQRDTQLQEVNEKLQTVGEELTMAQDVVQTRDTQLQEVNEKLQTVGEELCYARDIVEKRDAQLGELNSKLKLLNDLINKLEYKIKDLQLDNAILNIQFQKVRDEK